MLKCGFVDNLGLNCVARKVFGDAENEKHKIYSLFNRKNIQLILFTWQIIKLWFLV